ncbi:Cytosol aminopeptidase family catalytic domain [Trypanosoma vivax]|uniref:Putative aminopeptidase n=1 Tax=Trypanosoma vivax (strain Y486) TaxID=1055687 RepID=G0UBL4_TRYVY|nr:Cytosol aminopeptidase family catalytic domain [Trypanosoma vivax]CCC53211.1 putative aminopeptidase [Trypanosoma vivax Y486]
MTSIPRAEEKELSEFVRSCVTFTTNVSFTDIGSYISNQKNELSSPFALLIGTHAQLRDAAVQKLPLYCPAVAEAIERVKEGEVYGVLAEGIANKAGERFVRVVVGEVPAKASRTNCPARPDVISALVTTALEEVKNINSTVDIFVRSDAAIAVAVAVARSGKHSFSAKDGVAAKAYCSNSVARLQVIFPSVPNPSPRELEVIATSTQLCQRLVDTPPNLLNTATFAKIAEEYASMLGCDVDIICGNDLCEQGYGGMYSVGKAAAEAPRLVTLTYIPDKKPVKKVALVGKGIVYDCGGLALKPADFMKSMKHDMGGAAAVFCGFLSAVRLRQPVQLSCTLCLAENAIGPKSYRNDDIIVMKSGKTVEVNNTDAEGRIVLGDGVFHATNELSFVPDVLIDMATLTGAQGIATGRRHAGLFVSEEEAEIAFLRAGRETGETCFPVLYCPEYHIPEFKSNHADMTNLMQHRDNAGVSCGGQFVANHLSPRFKGAHVHVDLAFPTFDSNGATGFGAALLTGYFRNLC